mmetsp:Transcript_39798/g.86889  ORF Transcript_39798/g.86889 Transcript_39798/m.86889 type:complete len:235 (-) Transcript_39798:531-1235(-)
MQEQIKTSEDGKRHDQDCNSRVGDGEHGDGAIPHREAHVQPEWERSGRRLPLGELAFPRGLLSDQLGYVPQRARCAFRIAVRNELLHHRSIFRVCIHQCQVGGRVFPSKLRQEVLLHLQETTALLFEGGRAVGRAGEHPEGDLPGNGVVILKRLPSGKLLHAVVTEGQQHNKINQQCTAKMEHNVLNEHTILPRGRGMVPPLLGPIVVHVILIPLEDSSSGGKPHGEDDQEQMH